MARTATAAATAPTCSSTTEHYQAFQPDVVVSDTPLHAMDGFLIIHWLDQVGFTGCLSLTSGHEFLLSAARQFARNHRAFRVHTVAEDELGTRIEALLAPETWSA